MTPPIKFRDAITSRLKIMAKLDIGEKRLPQDGRIMLKWTMGGKKKEIDFRVALCRRCSARRSSCDCSTRTS